MQRGVAPAGARSGRNSDSDPNDCTFAHRRPMIQRRMSRSWQLLESRIGVASCELPQLPRTKECDMWMRSIGSKCWKLTSSPIRPLRTTW